MGMATGSASQSEGVSRGSSRKAYEVSKVSGTTGVNKRLAVYAVAGIIVFTILIGAGYFLAGRGKS